MSQRTGEAEWKGSLKDGAGRMKLGSGAFETVRRGEGDES